MIDFACSACRKKLRVKDESAGKSVKCPGCGQRVMIPALAASRTPDPGPSRPGSTVATQAIPPTLDATVDSGPRTSSDDVLGPAPSDFLAPPQGPDELGRLGPFRVIRVLGQGGMGMVFQAEDVALERMVALKTLLPALAANPKAKERFLREARSAAKIEHEHIISIHRVDEDRGVPYLAMPLLQGQPLDASLKNGRPVAVREAARIGREIAEGLAAAHAKGMIHRDIKPGNIWLEGDKRKVKILDFGLARAANDISHLTQTGAIVGTPAYMAPEQARGAAVDARADLFSLGCILYQMTTGKKPFAGNDAMAILSSLALDTPAAPHGINDAVTPELSALVMQLLEKQPDDRPASAGDVAEALRAVAEAAPTTAVARSPKTVIGRRSEKTIAAEPRRRGRRGLYAVIAVGVVVVAVAVTLLPAMLRRDAGDPPKGDPPQAIKIVPPQVGPVTAERHALELREDAFVEIPNLLIDVRKPFTLECNVRIDQTKAGVDPVLVGSNIQVSIDRAGRITFWIAGTDKRGAVVSNEPVPLKTWTHVAAVFDGKEQTLYINGRRQSKSGPFTPAEGTYPPGFHVGVSTKRERNIGKGLFGAVEGIRVSSVARYTKDFTSPTNPFVPDAATIALYGFDPNQPETLVDRSGNGLHGSIVAGLWFPIANVRPQRSLLVVFLAGGPSQIDTFDPKPGSINNLFPAIETSVPGIQFSSTLPNLAKQAHHLAVIRSMKHQQGSHPEGTTLMKTGRLLNKAVEFPSVSCVVGKELARPGVPAWVRFQHDKLDSSFLGDEHAPVVLSVTKEPTLANIEAVSRKDAVAIHALVLAAHRASTMPDERKRYPADVTGQQALLARKLIEAGVPSVEMSVGGWDHHSDIKAALPVVARRLDELLGTLISDLEASGRLKDTLIVVLGEFGRTTRFNDKGGRDHQPEGFSVVLGGGLIRGGQVIGKTSDDGWKIVERPVHVEELHATIYAAMGIDPAKTHTAPGFERIPYAEPGARLIAELLPTFEPAKAPELNAPK